MLKRLALLTLSLVATTSFSFGQAGFGTLAGTVTDASQAVIANAQITLTLPNGEQRTTTTNGSGSYQFTALPPGSGYTESVSYSGFRTEEIKSISVSVGTIITQNVSLVAGAADQVVNVTGTNVEQVQTETSAVSQLIDSSIWQNSPLEDRSQNNFITLVAGATPGNTGRGAAVSGARTGTGNFLVEGMDNNDQGQGGSGTTVSTNNAGGAVTTISPDAIQEYRVITHNPSAEYGRAGGFSTDTSLKSGTNKFHGSLFEYNRIQALAANDWFSNYNGVKDRLIRNQFGGSIGGPVYKDRTFFFTTLEIHRLRQGQPVTGTVTTQPFLDFVNSGAFENFQENDPNGVCQQYTGAACPGAFNRSATLGPVFQQLLKAEPQAFPLATQQLSNVAQGLYTGGVVTYPVPVYGVVTKIQNLSLNQERASVKIDHKLTEKDQISATYLLDFEVQVFPFAGGGGTFGPDEDQVGGSQLFTISDTHTFSPTLQNVFRAGYTRHVSNFLSPNTDGVPEIATAADPLSASFGASSGLPQLFTDNEFLYEDQLTKSLKSHTLKAGFRYVRTRNGSSFYNDVRGTLLPWDTETLLTDETFDDQADRALSGGPTYGSLYEASASIDTTTGLAPDPYRGYRANEFASYFQDDWKVNKQLVLNLGVRWEYFGPPHNFKTGFDSNVYYGAFTAPAPNGNPFLPNTPFIGAISTATFIQKNSDIWNKDTNNFAPRIGFSYDPTGKGLTALRGGFGIGYDRLYNNVYENIRFNTPRFSDNTIGALINGVVAGALEQPDLVNIPFTANAEFAAFGGKPVPRHIDQNLVTAYYEQANFGIEQQLAPGYVMEVNYIGTWGRKLVGLRDANNYDGRVACAGVSGAQLAACTAAGYPDGFTSHRPNLIFNSDNFRSNGFSSNYNGLQVSVRKGFSNGLMFLANYTWSKSMDEISDVFTTRTGQTGITDPLNKDYDYGPADFDARNLVSITANYEEPYKPHNLLLGGWGLSPIFSVRSGNPFSVYDSESTYDPNKDGREVDRAVYIGAGSLGSAVHRGVSPGPAPSGVARTNYLSATDFSAGKATAVPYVCPVGVNLGLWCDPPSQRNSFFGPHAVNMDLGATKRIAIRESQALTFEANFFNILNHPNFDNPISDLNNPNFGVAQADAGPRVTQLSLRFDF